MAQPPSMLTMPIFKVSKALYSNSEAHTRLANFKVDLPAARFDSVDRKTVSMSRLSRNKDALDSIDVPLLNIPNLVPRASLSSRPVMR